MGESEEVAEDGVTSVMGEAAPNREKEAEEGQFEPRKRVWGMDYDSQKETVKLPPSLSHWISAVPR